jgi:hypothetical protein
VTRFLFIPGLFLVLLSLGPLAASADPLNLRVNLGAESVVDLGVDVQEIDINSVQVEIPGLKKLKGSDQVSFQVLITNDSTNLSRSLKLKVKTTSAAPSTEKPFPFIVKARELNGKTVQLAEGLLTINAIFEIKIESSTEEADQWNVEKSTAFRSHKSGLQIRFINLDRKKAHRIHVDKDPYHQPAGEELAPLMEDRAASAYTITFYPKDPKQKRIYWCHYHEGLKEARELWINTDQN